MKLYRLNRRALESRLRETEGFLRDLNRQVEGRDLTTIERADRAQLEYERRALVNELTRRGYTPISDRP